MHSSRRDFLKLTGIALIGAAVPAARATRKWRRERDPPRPQMAL